MSAGLSVLLLAAGLALSLLLAHVEHKLYLRRRDASYMLEIERRARENSRPYGGVRRIG